MLQQADWELPSNGQQNVTPHGSVFLPEVLPSACWLQQLNGEEASNWKSDSLEAELPYLGNLEVILVEGTQAIKAATTSAVGAAEAPSSGIKRSASLMMLYHEITSEGEEAQLEVPAAETAELDALTDFLFDGTEDGDLRSLSEASLPPPSLPPADETSLFDSLSPLFVAEEDDLPGLMMI